LLSNPPLGSRLERTLLPDVVTECDPNFLIELEYVKLVPELLESLGRPIPRYLDAVSELVDDSAADANCTFSASTDKVAVLVNADVEDFTEVAVADAVAIEVRLLLNPVVLAAMAFSVAILFSVCVILLFTVGIEVNAVGQSNTANEFLKTVILSVGENALVNVAVADCSLPITQDMVNWLEGAAAPSAM
jgi:hypothetical protein